MSCHLHLALLTLALSASLVQSAPREALLTIYRVDQVGSPANNIGLPARHAFVPQMQVQEIPEQLDQNDVSPVQMHLLQMNLLKILILLDVIILMCVFYSLSSNSTG